MHRLTFCFVITVALLLTSCERQPRTLRVVTPLLPVDQEIARDIVDMLGDDAGVRLEMSTAQLSEPDALDALVEGEADVALISNANPYRDGIATVIPLYPTILHVAYRSHRDASTVTALVKGATVFAGAENSPSRRMFEHVVGRLDLAPTDFDFVNGSGVLADIVVLFIPVSPERVAEYPELRLFSLDTPGDIGSGSLIEAATLLNPQLRPFVIPAGTYGKITPEPVATLAVDKFLVAREDLRPTVIYDLIENLLRLKPALAAQHPGTLGRLSDDFDVTNSAFVLHAGTQDFLQREEPSIYERYSGVAEVLVTLLIGLVSATFASIRILQRRRKNRIDRFYSKAINIRDSITSDSSDGDRQTAIARVRELQNEAFDQLVHEKLSADESFRIFITLSHDVLRQLGDTGASEK